MRDTGSLLGLAGLPVVAALLAIPLFGSRDAARPEGPDPRPTSTATAEPAPPRADADAGTHVDRLVARVAGRPVSDARVLVMLVPDPDASSMDWMYDSHRVALRRAMEQAGYVADRFWVPRPDRRVAVPAAAGVGVDTLPEPEALPGVRVFRRNGVDDLAVVLTVGELPTSGVHRRALEVALDAAWRVGGAPDTVRVLGPSFSGTVPSLRSSLHAWRPPGPPRAAPCILVVSGSATATSNRTQMERPAPCGAGATAADRVPGVVYRATVHSDSLLQATVLDKVLERLEVDGRTALLMEASGYGLQGDAGERSPAAFRPIRIPFPLNISALRSAYEGNPPERDEGEMALPTPRPRLPISLRSEPRETEGNRSPLTPPTIDLVMEDIVAALEAHEVKAVGIVASDVRDKLFLAELLRRRLPGIHLFTYEGNILFRRADFAPTLRGMVVASTYPLLMEQQTWTGRGPGTLLPFENEQAAGVFNAALFLLGEGEGMRGYHTLPAEGNVLESGPPVWLTVAGRDRTLPLMLVRATSEDLAPGPAPRALVEPEEHPHGTAYLQAALGILAILGTALVAFLVLPDRLELPDVLPRLAGTRVRTLPAPAGAVSFSIAAAGAAALAGGTITTASLGGGGEVAGFIRACQGGSGGWFWTGIVVTVALVGLASLVVGKARRSPWLRRETLSAGGVAVMASAAPTAFLLARPGPWDPLVGSCAGLVSATLEGAGGVVLVVLAVSLVAGAVRTLSTASPAPADGTRDCSGTAPQDLRTWMGRHLPHVMALGLGLLTVLYIHDLRGLLADDPATFSLYRFRTLSLDSGMSALPVFFLATLGVLAGTVWGRNRQDLLSARRAVGGVDWNRFHPEGDGEDVPGWYAAFAGARAAVAKLNRRIENVAWPVAVAVIPAVLVLVASPDIGTLEAVSFEGRAASSILLLIGVLTGLTVIAAATIHLLTLWAPLRGGLRKIAQTPLAYSFERLPQRLRTLARLHLFDPPSDAAGVGLLGEGYRTLRERMSGEPLPPAEGAGDGARAVDMPDPVADGEPDPERTRERALFTLGDALDRAWRQDAEGIWEEAMGGDRARDGSGRGSGPSWLPVAESVAAMEIARYVDWVLRHVRRTALLLLVTILLTTASLEVLPLVYHDAVTNVLLVLVGIAVAVMFTVMASLSRDDILSRINGSPPGKISWSGTSMINVAIFMALPVLAILGTEIPPLGRALFSWITELMRLFSGV